MVILDVPLFDRYHSLCLELAGPKLSPGIRVESIPGEDRLQVYAEQESQLQGLKCLLMGAVAKRVDANYFIGLRIDSDEFVAAVADNISTVVDNFHIADQDKRFLLENCQVGESRWNMCLLPLKLHSPRSLDAVKRVMHAQSVLPSRQHSTSPTHISFAKVRALGACKLAAFVTNDSRKLLFEMAAQIKQNMESELEELGNEAGLGRTVNPHVSLLKITWPVGNKKAKAEAQAIAKRVKLQTLKDAAFCCKPKQEHTFAKTASDSGGTAHETSPASSCYAYGDHLSVAVKFNCIGLFQIDGEHPKPNEGHYYTPQCELAL
jgi:hypothetical protein